MYFAVLNKRKIILGICLLMVGIVSTLILSSTGAYSVFYGSSLRKLPIYKVQTQEKKVAISFDCAWGVDYTDKLLEIMMDNDVHCTFFMVEFWVKKHPDYVKKIYDSGHEIGTHSSTHPYMSKLDKVAIEKELKSSTSAIENIIDKKVDLFRAPYGDYDDLLIETAQNLGLYTIQWDVDSLDWKNLSAMEIINRVVKNVENGSIVLFHNQGMHTAEALPQVIKALKEKGYTFVRIGDLIYRDNYKMLPNGAQTRL